MPFVSASQAEIIRCTQKDEHYIFTLRGKITEISHNILGVENWLKWRQQIDILVDVAYFALTTLSGLQTLGEEYVNIVQVDSTLNRVPNSTKRLLSVLFHASGPYLLQLSLSRLQNLLNSPNLTIEAEQRDILKNRLAQLRWVIPILQRCHSVLFYFSGAFYSISKRITGIRYVLIRAWLSDRTFERAYQLLGFLSAVQLFASLSMELCNFSTRSSSKMVSQNLKDSRCEDVPGSLKCSLCLGRRKETTATPCGHLFCWSCITEWLDNKEQCPLCREKFDITRLICLQNFT